MPKQRLILIIGIVLAIIAVLMVKVYIDQQAQLANERARKRAQQEQANLVPVLVAKKDIPAGFTISAESLEVNMVPKQFVQPQAVTSLDRIAGMVAVAPISKGEQITLSKLRWPQEAAGGSLAAATPVGKRAITIAVDNIAGLAGMIKPGDYVDVVALLAVPVQTQEGKQASQAAVMPLFQNVLILAVGQETGISAQPESRYAKAAEKKEVSPLITLALSPQEANLIAFVQEQGKLRLILRSPADSQVTQVQPASWESLFQYLMPAQPIEPLPQAKPEVEYVEIYRGLTREKIPLSH